MLAKLYADERHKDVAFRLDSGLIVKAHRCVLMASGSSFFEKLLDPNSGFKDTHAPEIQIRECSDVEFEFVILSVYELDVTVPGIDPEAIFRLSARFDVMYKVSKFFNPSGVNWILARDAIELAFKYRPLFDGLVSKLKIDVDSLLYSWATNESSYSIELLTYLVSITPGDRDNFSHRLTAWLDKSAWPSKISHLDLLKPHRELLLAVLHKCYPMRISRDTLMKLVEMSYLEHDEVAKLISYVKDKICYIISSYPLKVGRIHKTKDPPKGEFICYYDACFGKCVDHISDFGWQFPVYRE